MKLRELGGLVLVLTIFSTAAFAEPKSVRWTGNDDKNAELNHVLTLIEQKTQFAFTPADFVTIENLDLANNHFQMLVQTAAGTPVKGMAIRIWTDLKSHETVQIEAQLESPVKVAPIVQKFALMHSFGLLLSTDRALDLARESLKGEEDAASLHLKDATNYWSQGELVRQFKFRGKHGVHSVSVSLAHSRVTESRYQ